MNLENEYGMLYSGFKVQITLEMMSKWKQTEDTGCLSSEYDDVKLFGNAGIFAQ